MSGGTRLAWVGMAGPCSSMLPLRWFPPRRRWWPRARRPARAVAAVGYPAYSYLGGASGADKADYSVLAGAPLVLVAPDRDRTGRAAALHSVLALLSLDPAGAHGAGA